MFPTSAHLSRDIRVRNSPATSGQVSHHSRLELPLLPLLHVNNVCGCNVGLRPFRHILDHAFTLPPATPSSLGSWEHGFSETLYGKTLLTELSNCNYDTCTMWNSATCVVNRDHLDYIACLDPNLGHWFKTVLTWLPKEPSPAILSRISGACLTATDRSHDWYMESGLPFLQQNICRWRDS